MLTAMRQIDPKLADQLTPEELLGFPCVDHVRVYSSGWVARSYKWPAPGTGRLWTRLPDGTADDENFTYDRKRSYGCGPKLTAFSARGGVLYSR